MALEVLAQRQRLGDVGFEVRLVARVEAAAADSRPAVHRQAVGGRRRRAGRRPIGIERIVELGAEIGCKPRGVGFERFRRPVARLDSGFSGRRGGFALGRVMTEAFAFLRPLQQGVARQLVLNEGAQFDVGHLQQLDRLKQLRRQNHCLALPHHQFGR